MDIDNSDIDLISQFRTMNTNDKDHLIEEFKRLSNTQLSNEGCCFFLDLAEWNLNTALWAYYEYDAPVANELPLMKFLCDITIGEGESVAPNTKFIKTWRIKNIGIKRWPYGCQLRLINSNLNQRTNLAYEPPVQVKGLEPDEHTDISVELTSPEQCGIYQSQYRVFTPNGTPFGDPIWLVLNVEQGGVLGITQQLNNVSMFGMNNAPSTQTSNAFNFSSTSSNFSNPDASTFNMPSGAHPQYSHNITETIKSETNPDLINNNSISINNNNINSNPILEDDKRPDFYDDMFS